MNIFDNITVTDIDAPITVHSAKGRKLEMTDRSCFGLSLCISGQITYTMGKKSFVSTPSNAVILPQGAAYSLRGDKEGIFPVINFKCDKLHCDEILVLPLQNPAACIKDCETIKNLFLLEGNRLKIYSAFYGLLDKVFALQLPEQSPLHPVIRYIEKNISDPKLSNFVLSEQLGISEVYLRKLFLTHYNTTPKQYILDNRIRKAKQLLIGTPLTVTAVSEECGFSSLYHFCRAFKSKTGITPTQYANLNKIYRI